MTQNRVNRAVVCITSEYIDEYCPDMTDSFVYLGCCYSAKDSVLAASFINKNCNVVLGFTERTSEMYDNDVMSTLINEMCKKRSMNLTGYPVDYYSIGEALQTVNAIYGTTNRSHGPNTRPILFGNRDYRFAEAIAGTNSNASTRAVLSRGSLQLESTYVSVDNGGEETVTIQSMPVGYTESDLIWTSDNERIATIDHNGTVHGVNTGSTRVTVVTKDGLYKQECFINVS